jgi:hypothetical protein
MEGYSDMKTAYFVKEVKTSNPLVKQKLFRLDSPYSFYDSGEYEYVIISWSKIYWPVTAVFGTDAHGNLDTSAELGEFKGVLTSDTVLAAMGYILSNSKVWPRFPETVLTVKPTIEQFHGRLFRKDE